ncbi:MAG: SH3 domain-containing protein [Clostridia bacterium]|nr:SH3 domain-containing protein [Clostridia bacterium]
MKTRRYISVILALALLLPAVFAVPANVSAASDYAGLNKYQVYFTRVIGSLARADYYEKDILASITVSQAIVESGFAAYTLPVAANNLFGIRAYFNSPGMIFDPKEGTVYASYADLMTTKGASYANTLSTWRANSSWRDSVDTHSWLFFYESKFKDIIGNHDYKDVARLLMTTGYCSDAGYADSVIRTVEKYGLTEYDDLTPDDDGIVGIIFNKEQLWLDTGETEQLTVTAFPEAEPAELNWKSDNESVATVDEEGNVKAIAHGCALITATLANGREACCIVYVDCNATIVDAWAKVHSSPDSDSGYVYMFFGTPVKMLSDALYYGPGGKTFYRVYGYNINGDIMTGYVSSDNVIPHKCEVSDIAFVKNSVTLVPGDIYIPETAVVPSLADDTSLTWVSSDPSVATVDELGRVCAADFGTAVITATAVNGVSESLNVTVAQSHAEYRALVTAYETLYVRKEPDGESSIVGIIPFLTEVRVTGEPVGHWNKITGLNTAGRSVTGYVNSAYLLYVAPKVAVNRVSAGDNIYVYAEKSVSSYLYGILVNGSDCAVIGEPEDGWSFVVGTRTPGNIQATYGYARLSGGGTDPLPGGERQYAETASTLRVRTGPGSDNDIIGSFPENSRIILIGEAENGWYRVTGTDTDGARLTGYASAEYIVPIMRGTPTTLLNLRAGPGTNYTSLAQLPEGEELLLFGEPENGWYRVEWVRESGNVKGYCSAEFIRVLGKYLANISGDSGEYGLTDGSLTLTYNMLLGVKAETKAANLLAAFTGEVALTDKNGAPLAAGDLVGTGCKLLLQSGGETVSSVTVIVRGDLSGNGKIDSTDYAMVKRAFLGSFEPDEYQYAAALVSGRSYITVTDYAMIKRTFLGTYNL